MDKLAYLTFSSSYGFFSASRMAQVKVCRRIFSLYLMLAAFAALGFPYPGSLKYGSGHSIIACMDMRTYRGRTLREVEKILNHEKESGPCSLLTCNSVLWFAPV